MIDFSKLTALVGTDRKRWRITRQERPKPPEEVVSPIGRRPVLGDLHYHAVNIRWPYFFAAGGLVFVLFNVLFALIYMIGHDPIANVAPGDFLGLFYFSIETLSTVGYGDMHPQTQYAHAVATVEIFTGMSLLAIMTGLIFSRFSRPIPRITFAHHPVVATVDDLPTLMIRMTNARINTITGAKAKLWLIYSDRTRDGTTLRHHEELRLRNGEIPIFSSHWMVLHTIDQTSPLFSFSEADLLRRASQFVLTVEGVDDTTSQYLHARRIYAASALRWRHRYVDILSTGPRGILQVDLSRFHEVEKDEPRPATPA